MNGLESARSVLAARSTCASVLAAALTLVVVAPAGAVTSADIVDGQVKTPDLASAAVTTPKIASNAVTGAKIADNTVTGAKVQDNSLTGTDIQDNSITGVDIDESTLNAVNATELNGFTAYDLLRIGQASVTSVVDLPGCSPGLAYLTKTITVPFDGNVLVTAMFTARVNGAISSQALAARVVLESPFVYAGIYAEDHTAYGSPTQRSNLVSTGVFQVKAGDNRFVLRVCDSSDTDFGAATIRGNMTFLYTPNPQL